MPNCLTTVQLHWQELTLCTSIISISTVTENGHNVLKHYCVTVIIIILLNVKVRVKCSNPVYNFFRKSQTCIVTSKLEKLGMHRI